MNVLCVRVSVLFVYTISISILCVSQEELSLIESNKQICDLLWLIQVSFLRTL